MDDAWTNMNNEVERVNEVMEKEKERLKHFLANINAVHVSQSQPRPQRPLEAAELPEEDISLL